MAIPYFFLWLMYFFITLEERNRYMMAKDKGMDCVHSENGFYIFGTYTDYYYDKNKKPVRRYLTWKEFWRLRGYGEVNKN